MEDRNLAPVIRAMLNDPEFMAGGIFSKERDYMRRYGLTEDEMGKMQTWVFWALHPETFPLR